MGDWLLPAFGVLPRVWTVKRLVCFSLDKIGSVSGWFVLCEEKGEMYWFCYW